MKAQTFLLALVLGCGGLSPQAQTQVGKTVSDATACALGVVATATGAVNVQGLLDCGLTVADALALLQQLRSQAVPPADAGAAVSPERVAYAHELDVAIADLQARSGK